MNQSCEKIVVMETKWEMLPQIGVELPAFLTFKQEQIM